MAVNSINYLQWLSSLDEWTFESIADAAATAASIHQALLNDGHSIVGEWLSGQGENPIQAWAHYPTEDCVDPETGATVYYHAHDAQDWSEDEHGHFHLFVTSPAHNTFTHVAAISMNSIGLPVALFATNGWVTDEKMLPAREILSLLDENWRIQRTRPSWLVLQWLGAFMTLTRPYIEELLLRRDQLVGWTTQGESSTGILDERDTHILSKLTLDWPNILESVQSEARIRFATDEPRAAATR
jgi:hypothetical protein